MIRAMKCIRLSKNMGALFEGSAEELRAAFERACADGLEMSITDYGMEIIIGRQLSIPVQASMFDHLGEAGAITIYCAKEDEYELLPIYKVHVSTKHVFEVSGVFHYTEKQETATV